MAQIEPLYVHRNSWAESFAPSNERVVWNAHRPLYGSTAWEGRSRWGTQYSMGRRGDAQFANWERLNEGLDAREVVLLDNQSSITLATQRCKAAGREEYGLAAYVRAYADEEGGAHEGAKLFVQTYELPWDDYDTTADALLAALATA